MKTPHPARDGKVDIFCPQCGSGYRIPVDELEIRVRCRHCQRVFGPRTTLGARRRPGPSASTALWAAAGLAAIVLLGVAIKSVAGSGPAPARTARQEPPKLGLDNPRVQALRRWVESVATGSSFGIEYGADLGALQKFLEVPSERNYDNAYSDERAELAAKIRSELATGERARIFRELELVDATLETPGMLHSPEGVARVRLEPTDRNVWATGGIVNLAFRMDGPKPVVTGWDVVRAPQAAAAVSDPDPAFSATGIAAPNRVRATLGDRPITLSESEPIPLDHLPDTAAALREEIDHLIIDLLDIDAPGPLHNHATDRLEEIGKPAIPRLLNKLYEMSGDVEMHNLELTRVDRALRAMTGRSFGYDPGLVPLDRERLQAQRISALKQWYAWWYRNHDRPHDLAIDKQDGLIPVKIKK